MEVSRCLLNEIWEVPFILVRGYGRIADLLNLLTVTKMVNRSNYYDVVSVLGFGSCRFICAALIAFCQFFSLCQISFETFLESK